MTPRKRIHQEVSPAAQSDLDALFERNPSGYAWALVAIQAAVRRPGKLSPKSKKLEGRWSMAFPSSPDDTKNSGRVVVDFDGERLVVVAVDDDHDRAYAKAKMR